MDVNALQLLRNRIADNRDDAYESLSHVRVHDGQPVVFRYYHTKEDGEQEIRALVAIGYNTKVWGRETFKIIWDDVYIEDQINLLFKIVKRLDDTLGELFVEPGDPSNPDRPADKPTVTERIEEEEERAKAAEAAATTEVKLNTEKNTVDHLTLVHTTENPGDQHNIYTLGLVDVAGEVDLNNEITRAKGEEATLQSNIDAEKTRAQGAENDLDIKIDQEIADARAGEIAATTEVSRNETSPNTIAHLVVSKYVGSKGTNANYVLTLNDVASESDMTTGLAKATTEVTTSTPDYLTVTQTAGSGNQKIYTLGIKNLASSSDLSIEQNRAIAAEKKATTVVTASTDSTTSNVLTITHDVDGTDGHNTYILKLDLSNYVTQTQFENYKKDLDMRFESFKDAVNLAISAFRASVSGDLEGMTEVITNIQSDITALTTRVTTNETNIANLQGRMSTAETNISNLTTRMGTAETNIGNLTTWVGKLAGAMQVDTPLNEFLQWNTNATSGATYSKLNYKQTDGILNANH